MAISLQNKTNVQAPDATWPFGKTLDDTGSNDGTPLDHATLTDYFQFFARMAGEAGITFNGLPDNDVNGWQYYQSLKMVTRPGLAVVAVNANALMSTYLTAYTNNYISQVLFNFTGQATAITFDLDSSANVDDGCYLMLKNNGNYIVTITPDGTDTINGQTSVTLLPGAKMELMLDLANANWVFKYGTNEKVVVGSGGSAPALNADYTGTVTFRRNNDGMVTICGYLDKNGGSTAATFTLPVGFRPSGTRHFTTTSLDASTDARELITVTSNGNVVPQFIGFSANTVQTIYFNFSFYAD